MIKRTNYISEIEKWVWKEKILILKWARQVGKTTLMKELEKNLILKWEKTAFLFADDFSKNNIFKWVESLIYFLNQEHDLRNVKWKFFLFIDEFQYIKNPGLFLKNIFDKYKDKIQIICSWSSSLEITKNTEFLTWRNIEFYIDKINYKEFSEYKFWRILNFNLKNFSELEDFFNFYKEDLERNFLEYLSFWWYPEIITSNTREEKIQILNSIYKNYIEKDIINFLNIENIKWFNDLIKILSSQIWNLMNKNEISSTIWISRITLDKYLDILKWTFIFNYIPPYYSNIRKELSKMPKVFWEDLWIINFSLWQNLNLKNLINIWWIVENFIYRELNYKNILNKTYFYQTISKAEIDFIYERFDKKIDIIEVKYRNKIKTPLIFKNFEENYKNILDKKIIITKDSLSFENWIYFIPACLFLFDEI